MQTRDTNIPIRHIPYERVHYLGTCHLQCVVTYLEEPFRLLSGFSVQACTHYYSVGRPGPTTAVGLIVYDCGRATQWEPAKTSEHQVEVHVRKVCKGERTSGGSERRGNSQPLRVDLLRSIHHAGSAEREPSHVWLPLIIYIDADFFRGEVSANLKRSRNHTH